MHARRCAAAAATALLLVLTGCSVPEPSDWTFGHAALLRPADDLRTIGDAWRESLTEGTVRANIPADAACYFHLEGGAVQDDVVCGPTRRAGHSATIWQQAPITSFYQRSGKVALTLGGDGSFRDVDPRSVGELRAADGSEPDLTVSIGPPRGTELAAGESVEVPARPQTADDRSTYGGCVLTDSALCTVDTAGDSGRRVLGLAGREVLVVFQDVRDAGYAAEPYDPASGTRLMAVTIINTRSKGVAGGGGSGEGESDDATLATLMPVGTEGALGGAEDGTLTASLAVGDEKAQGLGDLPETTVTADEVFDRLSSGAPPTTDEDSPAGTTVRLVAVPEDEPVVVTVSDGDHDAAFRSDEAPSSTTVPADQQDFFPIIDPYGDTLPAGMVLGVDGTLDLGGRTRHDTMPVEFRAAVSSLANSDDQVLDTADGRPRVIAFRPEGAHRAKYVTRVEIRDAELTAGERTVPLRVAADEEDSTEARATATADLAGIHAPEPAASGSADDADTALWDVRLQARVVLHLDLADDQDRTLPSDQPKHLKWSQDVDETPGIFGAPGYATVDGW
ncbi:hypothetical protein [Brachybacterium sp. NPDC056505]|uniref:hypothetical protein n=1 Tax=Brachybacterium sp. NPDC056505 TaxID=3345843 RepID=UPI00366C6B9B